MELVDRLLSGDKVACSRMITLVENEKPGHAQAMTELFRHGGRAHIIGITGPPGAGKSTLTDKLAKYMLDKGYKVGIIAVDPTSPFTKGAILGDRIRMNELSVNPNVLAVVYSSIFTFPRYNNASVLNPEYKGLSIHSCILPNTSPINEYMVKICPSLFLIASLWSV